MSSIRLPAAPPARPASRAAGMATMGMIIRIIQELQA